MGSIRDYWVRKLLFPKTYIIDKPGIIISNVSSKFGKKRTRKRMVCYFVDIFSELQLATIKDIGLSKSSDLWYKIGKDVGARYMLFGKMKKVPDVIFPTIVKYIFDSFVGVGFSVAKNATYIKEKKMWVLNGSDNLLCNKTGVGDVFAGILSATISFLSGKNIEGKMLCGDCPNGCKMVISPDIPFRYVSNLEEVRPSEDYNKLNFPDFLPSTRMPSFRDFFKFKKTDFEKVGKIYFGGKVVSLADLGFIGLISKNYVKAGKAELFEKEVARVSKKLAAEILKEKISDNEQMKFFLKMLCAFGWGIPHFRRDKGRIIFSLDSPPVSEYGQAYIIFFIKGFLDYILKRDFRVIEVEKKSNPVVIKISYG